MKIDVCALDTSQGFKGVSLKCFSMAMAFWDTLSILHQGDSRDIEPMD